MCGEPMPWRCHRLLIANTLTARGRPLQHIMGTGEPRPHVPGVWGAVLRVGARGEVAYPAE